ncbi:MAG: PAS domain S-box protein, partial [Gemmataceae bacterium]
MRLVLSWVVLVVAGILVTVAIMPFGHPPPIWPMIGIGLGACLHCGLRMLPGVFFANLALFYMEQGQSLHVSTLPVAGTFALLAVFHVAIIKFLVRGLIGDTSTLVHTGGITGFLILVGPLSATLGVLPHRFLDLTRHELPTETTALILMDGLFAASLGGLLFGPLTLIVMAKTPSVWAMRGLTVGMPLVIIILIILCATATTQRVDEAAARAQFLEETTHARDSLKSSLHAYQLGLRTLMQDITLRGEPLTAAQRQQLQERASVLLGMAYGLEGIAVATTVPGLERYDWEKKQSAGQSSPVRILEYDPQGNLRQAPAREHYLSVLFHSPSASGMVAPGQNLTQPEFGLIGEHNLPFLENGLLLRVPRPLTTLLLRPRMVALAQSFETGAGETLVVVGMFREEQLLAPLVSFGNASARFHLEEAVTDPTETRIQERNRTAAWWQTLPLNPHQGNVRLVSQANASYLALHRNPNRSFWGLLAVVGTIPLVMLLLVLTGQTAMVEALVERRSDELLQEMSVRALTENVLRTSQAQLMEAQRFARLGGWECDPYTEALYWSDEANIVFDLKTDGQELKLADLWLRLHPDHITNFQQSFVEATLSETYRATFEVQAWHRDGRLGYFMLAFRTVNDEGVPIIQGTIQEITEQKQIKQLKEFSEEQFRQVFESAAIGKAVVDLEGNILTANASLCDFLGITREELQTKSMRDVTHPDD